MMPTFTFKKRARVYSGLFASLAFVVLAIWGWDLPASTAGIFLLLCLIFLLGLAALAALLAWVIHKVKELHARNTMPNDESDAFK